MTRTQTMLGDKQPKHKLKFPCKLCKDDHLTHLCPHMEDASKFIAQGLTMFTNPLPNNQNMNSRIVDPGCASGGAQNPSEVAPGHGCINMVKATKVVTHAKYYGLSQPDLGKEPNPPESSLRIEKPTDKPEVPPRIPKGVLKHLAHNANARATQNYLVVKDLGQTPCAMFALEVRFRVVHRKGKLFFLLSE